MSRLIPIVFAIMLTISIDAQQTGIQFQDYSWEMALKKAKQEDKIIFVDAYTTWCGPCKWMAANVFTDESVGDYYNQHFVNIKMDMEKGEGVSVAKMYQVKAYPTLLFIDGDGNMVHKGLGSKPVEDFLELGHAASDPDRQIGTMGQAYTAGQKDPVFLKKYALALHESGDREYSTIAQEYLATQDDWTGPASQEFIFKMAVASNDNKLYQYIYSHREAFSEQFGKSEVDGMIRSALNNSLRKNKQLNVDAVKTLYAEAFPVDGAKYALEFEVQQLMYSKSKDVAGLFILKATEYAEAYGFSKWNFANSVAWRVYELSDNPDELRNAKKWAQESITLEQNYFNHDTLAAICFKLKEKELAIKHANLAIRLAKQDGIEPEETEKLLKQIEMME